MRKCDKVLLISEKELEEGFLGLKDESYDPLYFNIVILLRDDGKSEIIKNKYGLTDREYNNQKILNK